MAKTKQMCRGCRDDYYNQNRDGGCWAFKTAKIVKGVRVGIWENPPYAKDRAEKFLSCFSPDGYTILSMNDSRVVTDVAKTRARWDKENELRAENG